MCKLELEHGRDVWKWMQLCLVSFLVLHESFLCNILIIQGLKELHICS